MEKFNDTIVKVGETVARTTTVDAKAKTVTKIHVTQHGEGASKTHHRLTWVFDFSGCTSEQLLEVASRTVVIGARPTFKKCPRVNVPTWNNKTFDVAAMLQSERGLRDPVDTARNEMNRLTPEQLTALIAEYADTLKIGE